MLLKCNYNRTDNDNRKIEFLDNETNQLICKLKYNSSNSTYYPTYIVDIETYFSEIIEICHRLEIVACFMFN